MRSSTVNLKVLIRSCLCIPRVIVVVLLIGWSCAPAMAATPAETDSAKQPKAGGMLNYGMASEPQGLDPHVENMQPPHVVSMNIVEPLVYQSPDDLKFYPGLAASWEIAPDGLTYTFTLRKDIKFHDGAPFNAEAVKFNFDRIVDPATKSKLAVVMLGPYESTEIIDEHTVKVHLKKPHAIFLDALSHAYLGMLSPKAIKEGMDMTEHPVGTGPFMFKEWVRRSYATVVRNPDYNWPSPIWKHQGPAYLDGITFKFMPENQTRMATLETGETDLVTWATPDGLNVFRAEPDKYDITISPMLGTPNIAFINVEKPPTDDLKVRQAINYTIDQDAICNTLFPDLMPEAHNVLHPDMKDYYDEQAAQTYRFDPEKAQKLLDEAGWKAGEGGIREKDGTSLQLIMVVSSFWTHLPMAEFMEGQLREAGFAVEIRQVTSAGRAKAGRAGEHNLIIRAISQSDPDILRILFHSQEIGNFAWSFLRDKRLDEVLEQGLTEVDPAKRKALYAEAQRIIMNQAAIVPGCDFYIAHALHTYVKDFKTDVRGVYPWFYDVWLDK